MEKFTFFWRTNSPFSQWHPCKFVIDEIKFNSAEQYMMFKKALLFKDDEIAEKILASSQAPEQKALGRQVKGFDKTIWESECKNIVYDANYAKFTQNPKLKEKLLETEGTTIVEASPYDCIWGIGLGEEDPEHFDRSKWKGKNWLGEILTQVRDDIMRLEAK